MENLEILVNELRKYSNETTWLEFKHNNYNRDMIGQDISALANSATCIDKSTAYMIWGIDDITHDIVGTEYDQYLLKTGNQEIESWLRSMLSNNAEIEFHILQMKDANDIERKVVVIEIGKAVGQSVTFKKVDYIRVGSYTKPLNDFPTMKSKLWDKIRMQNYEEIIAKSDMTAQDTLNLIDFSKYFDQKGESVPISLEGILRFMIEEDIIVKQDNGLYGITNLGAILFAKDLSDFPKVSRKALRVVKYCTEDRSEIEKEYTGTKGYVIEFENIMEWLTALIPSKEIFEGATRKTVKQYSDIALRETIANALIHQDLSISGTAPIVEIFKTRIEITNPGVPLVDIKRIIDNPPKSRNEKLANLMRRLRLCEELGSGWDRIVISSENNKLPAPKITLYEENTKVVLYSEKPFSSYTLEEKIWACYTHSYIRYVSNSYMTNRTLRERFGLKETASASISRLIKEAVKRKIIKIYDTETAPRYMQYIPYWA